MAELGGAFAVSLLVLGEDNMVMMGVLLAVVMAAMACLLYTSPSSRDRSLSRMPSSA